MAQLRTDPVLTTVALPLFTTTKGALGKLIRQALSLTALPTRPTLNPSGLASILKTALPFTPSSSVSPAAMLVEIILFQTLTVILAGLLVSLVLHQT